MTELRLLQALLVTERDKNGQMNAENAALRAKVTELSEYVDLLKADVERLRSPNEPVDIGLR